MPRRHPIRIAWTLCMACRHRIGGVHASCPRCGNVARLVDKISAPTFVPIDSQKGRFAHSRNYEAAAREGATHVPERSKRRNVSIEDA